MTRTPGILSWLKEIRWGAGVLLGGLFLFESLCSTSPVFAVPLAPPLAPVQTSLGPQGLTFPQLPIGAPPPFSYSTPFDNTVVVPVPAIGDSFNSGLTYGTIVPILYAKPSGRITSIFAPSVMYNSYMGLETGFRYYRYYKGNLKRWHVMGVQSNSIMNFYEFHYRDLSLDHGRYIFDARAKSFKNPTARFYGIGPTSSFSDQSNYTLSTTSAHATFGANLDDMKFRVWFMERYRAYGGSPGQVPGMAYTGQLFPDTPGFATGAQILTHRANITYDTRDNHLIPSSGTYARVFAELDNNMTPGQSSVFDRFDAEYKTWIPHGDNGQDVLAIRAMLNLMNGPNIPFYAMSMLGGAFSLEGFGTGRFYDYDASLVNIEERIAAFDMNLFNVESEIQVAPFLGVGEVFRDAAQVSTIGDYAVNPGVGLRALVKPNVVGRVDIGYSTEAGAVTFVGIGFPF
ncbi:MAG: BamA/TamA family outer membrane protein [Leptospirillia bacterium]